MIETMTEIGSGLGSLMLRVFLILMPLLILLEWAHSRAWFKRFIRAAQPIFDPVGFRPQAIFPLMTGLLFGISYGAGVLIPQAQSGDLDRRQIFLVAAFLIICHAVFEDTLLFVVVGGTGWIMVTTRFVAAVIVITILSRLPWPVATAMPTPAAEDRQG